ncbi:MAG: PVC-type heme-binding CxxCH protein [Gemmataceae bacterium]
MVRVLSFCVLLSLTTLTRADDFPKPYDSEKNPGTPMPAEEAARKFKMPPGFKVSVFASEPDVRNPIACCWDGKGRLWVAENYTYAERPLNFDLNLSDRIVVFHDKDGDGKWDERKVFADNLKRLTSVCVGRGGVWVMCPPQLLFIPDADNDMKPDGPAQVILEGFNVPKENYHNFANGLKWGPDGWLYGRCGASSPGLVRCADMGPETAVPLAGGIWRYHPEKKLFEPVCHGTTNPWGHDWDANGNGFFVNSVNGHLWQIIPGAHYRRPHTISPNPYVYEPMEMIADHWHFDTGKGWVDSRKVDPTVDKLGGGHAHCGCMIYNGVNWPEEYRGKLMTLNIHGRRINVERLEPFKSGFVGKHEPDLFQAADPFFRGTELTYGPDGAVYVLDWSDTGECHENSGVHRNSGRIYRVTYGDAKPVAIPEFHSADAAQLLKWTNSKNGWIRYQALMVANERNPKANDSDNQPRNKQHQFAKQGDRWVVINDLQLLLKNEMLDTPTGRTRVLLDYHGDEKKLEDTVHILKEARSAELRMSYASDLQKLPVKYRATLAAGLLSHAEDADDPNIPFLIWYGLIPVAESMPESLPKLAAESKIPKVREWITRRLSEMVETKPRPLNELLALTAKSSEADRRDVLVGMTAGLAGIRKVAMPAAWKEFKKEFQAKDADKFVSMAKSLDVLFGDGRALDDVRKIALDGNADLNRRKAALAALISANPPDLRKICEQLLRERFLNAVAVKGLIPFNDAAVGKAIANQYGTFHPSERSIAIDALISRPLFAGELLDQMAKGRISRGDLSAAQARQIRNFNDAKLNENSRWPGANSANHPRTSRS